MSKNGGRPQDDDDYIPQKKNDSFIDERRTPSKNGIPNNKNNDYRR